MFAIYVGFPIGRFFHCAVLDLPNGLSIQFFLFWYKFLFDFLVFG